MSKLFPGDDLDSPEDGPEVCRFSCREEADQMRLIVRGDLDIGSVPAFRDTAFTAIGKRPALLLLDLSESPFIDTTGLGALVTVARVARLVKVPVAVRTASHLHRTLQVTGMAQILRVFSVER